MTFAPEVVAVFDGRACFLPRDEHERYIAARKEQEREEERDKER